MARSTLSSRFRRLDIDQYDENRFVEEPEEAAAAEPDASPEVEALLRQGEALRALHAALRSAPAQTRSAALKVSAAPGPAPVTSGISRRGAPRAPSSCSAAPPGRPLLKNGGVICARGQPRAAACHSAQGAARGVGKRARQHLMAERKS